MNDVEVGQIRLCSMFLRPYIIVSYVGNKCFRIHYIHDKKEGEFPCSQSVLTKDKLIASSNSIIRELL